MEPFNYEVRFKTDGSDKYGQQWFERNPTENGNYKAENGEKVLRIFESAFSNTAVQTCSRLQIGADPVAKIPVLWQEVPKSAWFSDDIILEIPAYRTTFNSRLLVYNGASSEQYNLQYHVAVDGKTVTAVDYVQFLPYGIEFADRTGYTGLHERCHKALIARINNGLSLTIQGKADAIYLNNLINCLSTENIGTAVYINFEPFVGFYTVQKVTTDGVICQFTLILNNE